MKIKIFITGGTIDSLEYENPKTAPKKQESAIPSLLKQARVSLDYTTEIVFFKDSKFVDEADREILLKKCIECPEEKIVITHGTMTMEQTAKYLGNKKIPKTIVFVGAAIPAKKENSDAQFNVGTALAAVQLLPNGVYACMNGRIFSGDNVRKNLKTGFFETIRD
ncbi:Uncharacterised protein [Candidatus Anstonella stagnisolia]|nr:Uncharacterised protein [Candidatus Anstonella stagnisolia]